MKSQKFRNSEEKRSLANKLHFEFVGLKHGILKLTKLDDLLQLLDHLGIGGLEPVDDLVDLTVEVIELCFRLGWQRVVIRHVIKVFSMHEFPFKAKHLTILEF